MDQSKLELSLTQQLAKYHNFKFVTFYLTGHIHYIAKPNLNSLLFYYSKNQNSPYEEKGTTLEPRGSTCLYGVPQDLDISKHSKFGIG